MHGNVDHKKTAASFRDKRYLYVKNFFPKPVLDYLKAYYRVLQSNDKFYQDDQCPLSLSVGGDPAFDAVLEWMTPDVSCLVGFDVAPTYSYTRIYAKGDVLKRHLDRPACEISVTVSIGIPNGAKPSFIRLKPPNMPETVVEMDEGDACIYAAMEVEHWREPFTQDGYIQLFLHFVDAHGEHFPELLYDKRKCLGAPYFPSAQPKKGDDRSAQIVEDQPKEDAPEQNIAANLLLRDGHQCRVKLKTTDPSLLPLLEAIAKRSDERAQATVFNLEMEDGEGSLIFAGYDLVAFSTNPAVSIDLKIQSPDIEFGHVIKENYLSSDSLADLWNFVEQHQAEFGPSKVFGPKRKTRKSLVLPDLGDFGEMFRARIRADMPEVLEKLQMPEFPIADIECQMTIHNNDHYFVRHRDSGPGAASRIVTFVYYFHKEPRGFVGGSLRLYKGKLENGIYDCGEAAVDINPTNNAMLFFPSACYHEVLPVKCTSGEFKDSRFTVNGWIRMAD